MKSLLSLVMSCIITYSFSQNITVSSGTLKRIEHFASKNIEAKNIDVWLPDNYSTNEHYAVLYMHDGQALYDATTTWNKQAWEVDEVASKLISENKTQKFIVVGIYNNPTKRHAEYFPQKPYESLTQYQRDTINQQLQKSGRAKEDFKPFSDNYLKFIVTELKPYIDTTFSTKTDAAHTFIAGSSMGGLISMYAICEYPNVFGGAACLSTHWPGTFTVKNNPIPDAFINYLKAHLPSPKNHKIYFDYGDQTLDALYQPFQEKVDVVMKAKGFTAKNWKTEFFKGKDHSENSWKVRLHIPLEFLLKK
jgi:predicted alpha/beta superfamily hydrolase